MPTPLEPKTKEFLDKTSGNKPLYDLPIEEGRKIFNDLQSGDVQKPKVQIDKLEVSTQKYGNVKVLIYRPEGTQEKLPFVVFFHGAGWVFGGPITHDRMVRDLTVGSQTAFVFVDYTLSPEAKYPTAIEQAYEVTKYVIKHAEELKLDPSRLAVAGDSVGGNMATAMALLAKERKDFKVDCQLLIYPVTDANFDNETYKEFANGPWLTKKAMEWFWDNYLPEKDKRKEITACPLQASLDQLRGLPSTIVITDDHDVLGGEGRAYAEKLKQAGVPVISKEIFGTCHDFMMINELANTNACKEAMTAACQFLKKELKAD